jgi:hypothetical protein
LRGRRKTWINERIVVVAREMTAEEDGGHGSCLFVRGSVEKLREFEN